MFRPSDVRFVPRMISHGDPTNFPDEDVKVFGFSQARVFSGLSSPDDSTDAPNERGSLLLEYMAPEL